MRWASCAELLKVLDLFYACGCYCDLQWIIRPEKRKRLKPGAPVLGEALSAIDRSSLGRLKRYFAFLSTVWTDYFCHLAGAVISRAAIIWFIHGFTQTVENCPLVYTTQEYKYLYQPLRARHAPDCISFICLVGWSGWQDVRGVVSVSSPLRFIGETGGSSEKRVVWDEKKWSKGIPMHDSIRYPFAYIVDTVVR